MPLAIQSEIEAFLQTSFDNDPEPVITTLIDLATNLIDAEIGRPAEGGTPITDELHRFAHYTPAPARAAVLLRRWPVTEIDSISVDGDAFTTFEADLETGIVHAVTDTGYLTHWTAGIPITVTYTPATIQAARTVAVQMVARAYKAGAEYANRPTQLLGLRQLTIGRWSATASTEPGQTAAEAISLTDAERRILERYRDRRP